MFNSNLLSPWYDCNQFSETMRKRCNPSAHKRAQTQKSSGYWQWLTKSTECCCLKETSHPTLRHRGNVATTSLCTSHWCRRYVSHETPNNVSMERRQDVSVIHLLHVLLERCNDVLKGRNIDIQSLHPHDVSKKSQMKHPMTSQWYVSTTSLRLVRLYDVSCNSQIKQPKTLLWYVSTTPWSYVFATSC